MAIKSFNRKIPAARKGLQKFANFETIKTKEALIELKVKEPVKFVELFRWLQDKVNKAQLREEPIEGELDKYFNRLELAVEVMEFGEDTRIRMKRDRWYVNEAKIKTYMHYILTSKKYLPTNTEIAQKTGLSRVTVDKHIKGNGTNVYKAEELDKYRMLNSQALNQLYHIGIMDKNVKALKAFIEYSKHVERPAPVGTVVNNNFIQINNLTLSQENINRLNPEQLKSIEAILKNALPGDTIQQ